MLSVFLLCRGIECDVWAANVSLTFNRSRDNTTTALNFTASFYFPVNQWLVDRESYHRMLKAVILNGTRNGQPFETWINYVNFRPRTVYPPMFDVCAISPYVRLDHPLTCKVFDHISLACGQDRWFSWSMVCTSGHFQNILGIFQSHKAV